MNLRDLEYFAAVADCRHFGRAAEMCHVSQPTLSTQVRKLENELGVELFERGPRGATLTAAGEEILERTRVVLREASDIVAAAKKMADPTSATLRIGLFPTLGPYLLPHVIPDVRRRFPRLELRLVEAQTGDIVERLDRGELDAALLALPIEHDAFEHVVLFDEDFVLAVPSGHHLAATTQPVPVDVLAGQEVLLLEDGHCLRDQALAVCSVAGASERAGFRATSLETMRQMVAANVGVTLLPRLAVSPPVPAPDTLELVELSEPVPSRTIGMFWRTTSAYRTFLPELADVFRVVPADLVRAGDAVAAAPALVQ